MTNRARCSASSSWRPASIRAMSRSTLSWRSRSPRPIQNPREDIPRQLMLRTMGGGARFSRPKVLALRRGQHRLIGIEDQPLHIGRHGQGEPGFFTLSEDAADIELALSGKTIHGDAGYQIGRREVLLDRPIGGNAVRAPGKFQICKLELGERRAIHPSVEKPIQRLAAL